MNRKLLITLGMFATLALAFVVFRYTLPGALVIGELAARREFLPLLVLVGALLDSVNPCAFSVLILTVAFLFSIGKLRSKILEIGAFYVLGIFAVYLLIGLGILQSLHLFNTPHFMAKVGAALLVLIGLINLAGEFIPRFPIRIRIPSRLHHAMATLMDRASLPAVFLLGAVTGLCEFPCTGGPYLMVLGLLHDQTTYARGVLYLVAYNLIFILPLVIMLILASDKGLLNLVQKWQQKERRIMRVAGGVLAILLGLFIFSI